MPSKIIDVVEWLEAERDARVEARKKLEEQYSETTMSMAPPDDGASTYLYDAAQEIKKSRDRLALMTQALKTRGHEFAVDLIDAYQALRDEVMARGLVAAETLKPYFEKMDAAVEEAKRVASEVR